MISKEAYKIGMMAYKHAKKQGIVTKPVISIVDFTKPSTIERLAVYNGETEEVLLRAYVTHGSGSGGVFATDFSNVHNSHKSSIGVYKTSTVYYSQKFKSNALKVDGLDKGFNDNARARAIVIHWARQRGTDNDYIGQGKTGRSWGCFAVPKNKYLEWIKIARDGTLLVAYYPDQDWLKTSKFLKD